MKKWMAAALAAVLCLALLTACGGGETAQNNTSTKLVILEETLAPEDFAIGFRKGENSFCNKVDEAIDELIEDGSFAELSDKWFGKNVAYANRKNEQSNASQTEDDSWKKIQDKGKIVLGMDDSFPPMGFRENGELTGFDVELAKAVGKKLGVEVELQAIDWKTKDLELSTGKIDVIWNGYSVTPERAQTNLLSKPYMTNTQVVMVKEGSDIKTLEDLRGKKVAVQDGSSAQKALETALATQTDLYDSIDRKDFKDNMTASLDLESGNVDALAIDSVVANYLISKKTGN